MKRTPHGKQLPTEPIDPGLLSPDPMCPTRPINANPGTPPLPLLGIRGLRGRLQQLSRDAAMVLDAVRAKRDVLAGPHVGPQHGHVLDDEDAGLGGLGVHGVEDVAVARGQGVDLERRVHRGPLPEELGEEPEEERERRARQRVLEEAPDVPDVVAAAQDQHDVGGARELVDLRREVVVLPLREELQEGGPRDR